MKLDLIKNIYDRMLSHQFVVSYMGDFNQDLLKSLLSITEKKLDHIENDKGVKNKIFHFMIECVQNICKIDQSGGASSDFMFLIGKKNDDYIMHSGGVFSADESRSLIERIQKVNSLTSEEVKERYYEELKQKNINKESQILISLLDISKRTRSRIEFAVQEIDDNSNFLSFKTIITK